VEFTAHNASRDSRIRSYVESLPETFASSVVSPGSGRHGPVLFTIRGTTEAVIERLPLFISITFLMLIVPGPDFVLVTRNSVLGGRSKAYLTAAGICTGLSCLTVLTAGGISTIVASNSTLLTFLRLAGGTYLLLLGTTSLYTARNRHRSKEIPVQPSRKSQSRSPMAQGFLNNILNPYVLLFYLTLMPQFIVPGSTVFTQTLVMGFLVVLCAATWWTLYVTVIGQLSAVLQRSAVRLTIDIGASAALGALGIAFMLG
jgi:threonine/homoserine/homoserine lactone efflux protein